MRKGKEGGEEEREGGNKEQQLQLDSTLTKGLSSCTLPTFPYKHNTAHLCPCCQGNLHDPLLAEVALTGGGGSNTVSLVCLQVDTKLGMRELHTQREPENSCHVQGFYGNLVQVAFMATLANDL